MQCVADVQFVCADWMDGTPPLVVAVRVVEYFVDWMDGLGTGGGGVPYKV